MDVRLLIVAYLMICILPVSPSPYRSKSRNRNSSPTYDQKQTGEYNIQLHLKDFEIVALLADSTFGELGDYDYNYDYSELTVKPGVLASTTTKKPLTSTKPSLTSSSTTNLPLSILNSQKPIIQQSPHTDTQTIQNSNIVPTTEKIINLQILTSPSTMRSENEFTANITKDDGTNNPSTIRTEVFIKPVDDSLNLNKEQINQEENMPLVVHRKCASGFTRDKLGRCRRVRRPPPQFSFGISRLATLASKLRQGTNETQTTEESIEINNK